MTDRKLTEVFLEKRNVLDWRFDLEQIIIEPTAELIVGGVQESERLQIPK